MTTDGLSIWKRLRRGSIPSILRYLPGRYLISHIEIVFYDKYHNKAKLIEKKVLRSEPNNFLEWLLAQGAKIRHSFDTYLMRLPYLSFAVREGNYKGYHKR